MIYIELVYAYNEHDGCSVLQNGYPFPVDYLCIERTHFGWRAFWNYLFMDTINIGPT